MDLADRPPRAAPPARTTDGEAAALAEVARRYATAITPALADLIDPADPADPIARQFLPDPRELAETPNERADPIGDAAHSPLPGLIHRYADRVLLTLHHACPVYCRFCFRRTRVGPGGAALDAAGLDAALAYIEGHPEIWEVILSGGDPLLVSPRRLDHVLGRLDAIAHVGVVRLHSRVPVADPGRVTAGLVAALRRADTAVWMSVHTNHPRELTDAAAAALARLVDAGVPVVSQTVLLRGVNDDPAVLEALFRRLVRLRVKPYYLHHPDAAPGTAHFRLSLGEGQAIAGALRGRLSGLCQPTYVLDIPGGHGKVPVGPCYARPDRGGTGWTVADPAGGLHDYRDDIGTPQRD
ncbi:MAG: lysine-2,3-aminomutase-like protein [Rhodospirillaceae bacterium]|nr:lysine-2,3-aminomutase-like protein [Rhodospirillaceae bacterium]